NAERLFELKRRVDPTNKFRNRLWDAYYQPTADAGGGAEAAGAGGQAARTDAADATEPALAQARAEARRTDGYLREESQTYLTLPEWFLVFSPDEYAHYLRAREPSGYPYFGAVGQFWSYYRDVIRLTKDRSFNWGYHLMVFVIGTSFSAENII